MQSAPRRAEQPDDSQHVRPRRAKAAGGGNEAWKAIDREPRWSYLELRRYLASLAVRRQS
jgi:hypothetical protein